MPTVLMAFVTTAALCFRLWDVIMFTAHVKKIVLLSLRKNFSEAFERGSWTNYWNNTYKRRVLTSLRCTNKIGGKCKRLKFLLNGICTNPSPTKCFSEKKDFCEISNLEVYSVMFNVIMKYRRIRKKLSPTFHPSTRRLLFVEMTLDHL